MKSLLQYQPRERQAVVGLMSLSREESTSGFGRDEVILKSTRKDKKYMILNPKTQKWIHFGSIRNGVPMEQYRDQTPLKLYKQYDHGSTERRKSYLKRHKAIIDSTGQPAYLNKWSPSYLSIRWLW